MKNIFKRKDGIRVTKHSLGTISTIEGRRQSSSSIPLKESPYIYTTDKSYFDKMPMPHCDQTIMHGPNKCKYCDQYPEYQALREWWNINFTNEHDPEKAPCPSTHRRSDEKRDRWYGNVERTSSQIYNDVMDRY